MKFVLCRVPFILLFHIAVAVAVSVPHLDLMISLIGALSSSAIALIYTPVQEMLVMWPNDLGRFKWKIFKDILLILFGFVGFVAGTVTTLISIADAFSSGKSTETAEVS